MDSNQSAPLNQSSAVEMPLKWLTPIATRLIPELMQYNETEQALSISNTLVTLFYLPLVIISLIILLFKTDFSFVQSHLAILLAFAILGSLAERLTFSALISIGADLPGTFVGNLADFFNHAALLIFGLPALWLPLLQEALSLGEAALNARRSHLPASSLNRGSSARNRSTGLMSAFWGGFLALAIYHAVGGETPMTGLTLSALTPALLAIFILELTRLVAIVPYVVILSRFRAIGLTQSRQRVTGLFVLVFGSIGLSLLISLFSPLLAGLYTQAGIYAAAFLTIGVLLVGLLAHQLSHAIEQSRNRTREVTVLQKLAQAILRAPPDGSALGDILTEFFPQLIPYASLTIWLKPDQILVNYQHSADHRPVPSSLWPWLIDHPQLQFFEEGSGAPWDGSVLGNLTMVAPIYQTDSKTATSTERQPIGGLYLSQLFTSSDKSAAQLRIVAQVLIDQIETALSSIQSYHTTLQLQKVDQELQFGSQIQHSFLPESLPTLPGWLLSAVLEPARQTSGDFYDCFALADGCWALVVADVADKGVGAALYMALARTLIRTYAAQIADPGEMLTMVNRRILQDSQADLFVTVFYAVLNPTTAELTYANAGHNPAIWTGVRPMGAPLPSNRAVSQYGLIRILGKTGIPLGMFANQAWTSERLLLEPQDQLLIYTDGLTEAQNTDEAQFGEARLFALLETKHGQPLPELQAAILDDVHHFIGTAQQFDDITMLLLAHTEAKGEVNLG